MSERSLLTRRAALKLGLGAGAMAVGLEACGSGADRCPAGPPPALPDGGAATAAQRLLSGIDTIVVVMMENRSFDHLIGSLEADAGSPAAGAVDGLGGTERNLDANGLPVIVNLAP